MNLLHVIPYYAPAWSYGGAMRAATDLARALPAGHTVCVLTTDTLSPTARTRAGRNHRRRARDARTQRQQLAARAL